MNTNSNEKDILALETIAELKNYNSYTFNLISQKISGKSILDFGSGYGVFCQYMVKKGYKVNGFEINNIAYLESKERGINTYSKLNQIDKKFDTITSSNVLEHIEDDIIAINQMRSLLVEKGTLILYLPASQAVWTKMDDDVNHFRRYSKKDLHSKLESANFEILESRYVDFIGWFTLIIFKIFKIKPKFNKKLIIFYDKFFFKFLKYLDIAFKNIIGKNILVVARKN
ncbi:MAG: hypothetical protein CBC28_04945 [Flavobacteriaceae bacterium TMED68]|nr:MAG: hypothetical protein CBC28_04945 [Flavobacteriaceae bacterium TMED68]|tara:strand:- start:3596 stop:4279 length:684 start_codon:yes stop_codon:yes gene_type:complete